MGPEKPRKRGEKGNDIRQLAMLSVVPAMMVVAPFVGFFIGDWADGKFGTEPFLAILGLILGFASAGKEINDIDFSEQVTFYKTTAASLGKLKTSNVSEHWQIIP